MTALASGALRLRAGADTLVIFHRSSFGYGRGLTRLESEDAVRRYLLLAMTDHTQLQSLRLFWGRYSLDTRNLTHTPDAILIDQVAVMTVRGPLSAYIVPDGSVKHVHGSAAEEVRPGRQMKRAAPSVIAGNAAAGNTGLAAPSAGVDAPSATAIPGTQKRGDQATSGPLQVALMTLDQRILEVLERTQRRMPASVREDATKLFVEDATLATIVQVLTTWVRAGAVDPGFMMEALLVADGLIPTNAAAIEASEKFDEAFELVRRARDERQFDEAAVLVAEAIARLGIPAFLAAVWRGANRFSSPGKRGSSDGELLPFRATMLS
jgi:hypothetical protein